MYKLADDPLPLKSCQPILYGLKLSIIIGVYLFYMGTVLFSFFLKQINLIIIVVYFIEYIYFVMDN